VPAFGRPWRVNSNGQVFLTGAARALQPERAGCFGSGEAWVAGLAGRLCKASRQIRSEGRSAGSMRRRLSVSHAPSQKHQAGSEALLRLAGAATRAAQLKRRKSCPNTAEYRSTRTSPRPYSGRSNKALAPCRCSPTTKPGCGWCLVVP
jgi:hypothetical protein